MEISNDAVRSCPFADSPRLTPWASIPKSLSGQDPIRVTSTLCLFVFFLVKTRESTENKTFINRHAYSMLLFKRWSIFLLIFGACVFVASMFVGQLRMFWCVFSSDRQCYQPEKSKDKVMQDNFMRTEVKVLSTKLKCNSFTCPCYELPSTFYWMFIVSCVSQLGAFIVSSFSLQGWWIN